MSLRFGVHTGQQNCEFQDLLDLWRQAESLGYDWASVFDHFLPIFSPEDGPCFEGMTALAGLAMATKTMRCGIIVTGVTYRNPVLLAKAAVTIDHLSGGRMELGIGAAWHDVEHQQYGFDFPSVGTRMDMLDEASAIIKMLFRRDRSDFRGEHFQLDNAIFLPKPVNGNIPLWIGGGGEKRTLRSVAQYADGWNYFMTDPEEYRHKLSVLHQHCKDSSRDAKEIRQGLIVRAVLDQDVEAPDATTVVCSSGELVEKLKAYRDLGVEDFLLLARPPADQTTLEAFIGKVAPALRA